MKNYINDTTVTEAIILAGGLGTRLQAAIPGLPKCMAPVNGQPFLAYIMFYLQQQGIHRFIFSLGYMHEMVEEFLHHQLPQKNYQAIVENNPLGTGGAIKLACGKATGSNVIVVNGDTLFNVNLPALSMFHVSNKAECTVALKPMKDVDRYGVVEINKDASILSFKEKQYYASALINGGLYALNVAAFLSKPLPEKFSFEKNYLEAYYNTTAMYGQVQDEYFIDIGIPEDYNRAQEELKYLFT
ncbi:nucleotidyltransferase family protein [Foetidibacter luteolus]|uniref:nucleotidyltransferase family protein n=1 Tax=Foetidibacter luteolus TaxID=2608880 RepID=UPI001F2BB01B|nr:nucleotidyltransferase family protein [Foetidibacter luteolus]